MDETLRGETTGRGSLESGSCDRTTIALLRIAIAGACAICRKQTESVVRLDAKSVAFLCPSCGTAARQAAA
jgi:hypothetical protein